LAWLACKIALVCALASREPLAKRRAQPVTGIRQHTAKAHTGRYHAIDLS
jgi:hypothetical protein